MTTIPTSDAEIPRANGRQPEKEPAPLSIESRWLKPLVSVRGGEATLLVRILAPEQPKSARRAPLDVSFVLDRSGSMRGEKLDLAKEGVSLAVSRLRDADRTALVVYDDQVDVVHPLESATPRCKASLRVALHGVDAGGSTYLSGGWVAGCQQLAEAPTVAEHDAATRIRRAILLTDGLANVGILEPRELAQHAGELRRRGIATTTVGVGLDFDEGLLSAMAEAGGGNFQYVAIPDELREFFSRELQELFSVSATGLTLTLTLPPGLDAELVSAFPVAARDSALKVAIGDVPSGDEIDLVFNVRAGHGEAETSLMLGVTAEWTDPHADARRQADAHPLPLRRADESEIDRSPADELVAERTALQRAAAERRAGLELDRQGRYRESRERIALAQQYLLAAPPTDAVRYDLMEGGDMLLQAPDTAYSQHVRKSSQHREHQRRRGRLDRATPEPDTLPSR